MPKINWDKLSLDEIKDIQKQANKAYDSFKARKLKEARAAAEAAAAAKGFTLSELVGGAKSSANKSAPKYAHPENPAKTWTGKGRQPNWVKDHIGAGKDLGDLLI